MILDQNARRNLELTETLRDRNEKGVCFGLLIVLKPAWEPGYYVVARTASLGY